MKTPAILACGEVLWDLFPDGPRFGGAPANFACHAALQGARVSLLSAVGDDARGREAVTLLTRYGVDPTWVQRRADVPTGAVTVTVDAAGKPSFTIETGAAWDFVTWTPDLAAQVAAVDAVYFGTLGQREFASRATIRRVLAEAEARGVPRVLDVNLRRPFCDAALIRESVARATILKLSDDELPEVAGACGLEPNRAPTAMLAELCQRYRLDLVALTRGADGALLVSPNATADQPGIPTVVRDTVGAGDAFTAALTVGHLRGDPLPVMARRACEIAATVCAHAGAVPEPPADS
jgi:fructokinase